MRKHQSGFTLIELMIVVAIIGILATIAAPSLMDQIKRARMSEVLMAASPCKGVITEVVISMSPGATIAANDWGCEVNTGGADATAPSQYVRSVTTDENGVITVTARGFNDANIDGGTMTLTPYTDGAMTTPLDLSAANKDQGKQIAGWKCEGGTLSDSILPATCR